MNKPKLQIQAVLYHPEMETLLRAFESLCTSARWAGDRFAKICIRWGDAGEKPSLAETDLTVLRSEMNRGETPDSPPMDLEYIFFGENTGYGRGNNILAGKTDADFLLIMNPEICLPPRGISDLAETLQTPEAGIAEARQIPVEHPKAFDPETYETEWASGACFMIPCALFRELGGFDADTFFMYCEDVDLSWRVRLAGKKVLYQPLVGAFHPKRLGIAGESMAGDAERRWSILSDALLAYKWSYPFYARERIRKAVLRGDPGAEEAQREFEDREREGLLPAMLDPEHRIAHTTFFPESGGMLYTQHRYMLQGEKE